MKKYKKILLISAGCMVVAGGILFTTGYALGGKPGFTFSNNKIIYQEEPKNYVEKKETLKNIKSIELSCDDGNIYIEQGEAFYIEYGYYESIQEMQVEKEGDKLKYSLASPSASTYFTVGTLPNYGQRKERYIKLVIPEKTELSTITAISDYGKVNAGGIKTKNLTIRAESGDVNLNNLTADHATISLDYGELLLNDSKITTLDLDNESGSVTMEKFDGKEMKLELGYGTAKISRINTDRLELENESGEIRLNEVSGFGKNENVENIFLTGDYGDMKMSDVKAENLVLNNESGSLEGDQLVIVKGKINMGYGELSLTNLNTKDIDVKNESGNIILGLTKQEKEYDFALSTDGGKIIINDRDARQNIANSQNAQHVVKADTEYGIIKITTAE